MNCFQHREDAHFDTVQLPFAPALLQRIALVMGAPMGKVLGYQATYIPAAVPAAATA